MKNPVYEIVVDQFTRNLNSLRTLLQKAKEHASERKFDENNFLQVRLAPDMFPFVKQVQMTTDNAKGAASRLAGVTAPKFEDNEKSLDELISRVNKTVEYLSSLRSEQFNKYAEQKISFPWYPGKCLEGDDYFVSYAIPNFYFHLTTSYAILRNSGVPIGKGDFLGEINWKAE
jgi:hypothetical protein